MDYTQYKIYKVTDEGNKYSVVFINNNDLKVGQKVNFKEVSGDFYIYRVYNTFDINKINEEKEKISIYTLT